MNSNNRLENLNIDSAPVFPDKKLSTAKLIILLGVQLNMAEAIIEARWVDKTTRRHEHLPA